MPTAIAGGILMAGAATGAMINTNNSRAITSFGGNTTISPGFSVTTTQGPNGPITSFNRANTPEQQAFDARFPRALGDIDALRASIRPGFSQLRRARLEQVENARRRSIGTLRENLARRRVLGSSFADDAFSRTEREFADAKAAQEAQSFLEELAAGQQLTTQEMSVLAQGLQREFVEAGIAAQQSLQVMDILQRATQFDQVERRLQAQERNKIYGAIYGTGSQLAFGGGGGGFGTSQTPAEASNAAAYGTNFAAF